MNNFFKNKFQVMNQREQHSERLQQNTELTNNNQVNLQNLSLNANHNSRCLLDTLVLEFILKRCWSSIKSMRSAITSSTINSKIYSFLNLNKECHLEMTHISCPLRITFLSLVLLNEFLLKFYCEKLIFLYVL